MKKRMLITSVVMVLVVALALSTATYAWFSSNTTVTATNIDITATASDGDGILIGMGYAYSGLSNTVGLTGATLKPATPNVVSPFTTAAGINEADFLALIDDGNYVVNSGGGAKFKSNVFYVYNVGTKAVTLKLDIAVTNAATCAYGTDGLLAESAIALTPTNIASYRTASTTGLVGEQYDTAKAAMVAAIADYDRNFEAIQSLRIAVVERAVTDPTATNFPYTPESFQARRLVSISQVIGTGDFGTLGGDYAGAHEAVQVTTDVYGATVIADGKYYQGDTLKPEHPDYSSPNRDTVGGSKVTDSQQGFTSIAAPGANNYICYQYEIITWLEGWDSDCTNNAGSGQFSIELIINPASAQGSGD